MTTDNLWPCSHVTSWVGLFFGGLLSYFNQYFMQDLFGIGVTALGPRKKIIHALSELRKVGTGTVHMHVEDSKPVADDASKLAANKLITDYFPGSVANKRKSMSIPKGQNEVGKSRSDSKCRRHGVTNHVKKGKVRDIPVWCCVPGTPFRVVNCL